VSSAVFLIFHIIAPHPRRTTCQSHTFVNYSRPMNKEKLRQLLLDQLELEWRTQSAAADLARDEATHAESRPDSKYDTHSQEAAYLAEGQARLAADIAEARAAFQSMPLPSFGPQDPVALGALIQLEQSGGRAWYFVGPYRGGTSINLAGQAIMVITPQSPLGRRLMGATPGSSVVLPRGSGLILTVQ
jgi:transcription elongation GreA/GreB family factor